MPGKTSFCKHKRKKAFCDLRRRKYIAHIKSRQDDEKTAKKLLEELPERDKNKLDPLKSAKIAVDWKKIFSKRVISLFTLPIKCDAKRIAKLTKFLAKQVKKVAKLKKELLKRKEIHVIKIEGGKSVFTLPTVAEKMFSKLKKEFLEISTFLSMFLSYADHTTTFLCDIHTDNNCFNLEVFEYDVSGKDDHYSELFTDFLINGFMKKTNEDIEKLGSREGIVIVKDVIDAKKDSDNRDLQTPLSFFFTNIKRFYFDEVDKTCCSQSRQMETSLNQNSFIPEWEKFTETSFSELLSASAASFAQAEDSTVDLVAVAKFEELARATDNFDSRLLIGSGSFGDVFLADFKVGGRLTKVAVKRFKPVFYASQTININLIISNISISPKMINHLEYN